MTNDDNAVEKAGTMSRDTLFSAYLTVDWSASSTAKTGSNSIWYCLARREGERNAARIEILALQNPATRHAATGEILRAFRYLVSRGDRILVPISGEPKDATQVRDLALLFAQLDTSGELQALLDVPGMLQEPARSIAMSEEGWILGAGAGRAFAQGVTGPGLAYVRVLTPSRRPPSPAQLRCAQRALSTRGRGGHNGQGATKDLETRGCVHVRIRVASPPVISVICYSACMEFRIVEARL